MWSVVTSVVSGCGQDIERSSELRDRAWHVHCSIAWHQGGDRVVEWWSDGVVEWWSRGFAGWLTVLLFLFHSGMSVLFSVTMPDCNCRCCQRGFVVPYRIDE